MSLISDIHSYLRRSRITRVGSGRNGSEAPMGQHKTYLRMPRLKLPEPEPLAVMLLDAIKQRESANMTDSAAPLTLEIWGTLLGAALRTHPDSHRRYYPSGGGLYPIETYVLTSEITGQLSAFHYDPTEHSLEVLWELPASAELSDFVINPYAETHSSALIVFTSMWERSAEKYGLFSYPLALLDAGHMSENVLLVAAALKRAACPLGGFKDQALAQALDLDAETEQPVFMINLP